MRPDNKTRPSDIPLPPAGPVQPLRHGEDAFAMVNRHHEEVKALYRQALARQAGRDKR